jgi:hypothetical protein
MFLILVIVCACFALAVTFPSYAVEAKKVQQPNAAAATRPPSGASNPELKSLNKKASETPLPTSIVINNPGSGDTVLINQTCEIKWTRLGQMNNIVDIEASLVGTNTKFAIVGKTLNDGSYSWAVLGLKPGKYIIRIITADSAVKGESNPFDVVDAALDIVNPAQGAKWWVGQTVNITWKASMLPDEAKISINYIKADGVVVNLGNNLANSGTFAWNVTAAIVDFSSYHPKFSDKPASNNSAYGTLKVSAVANGKTYVAERQISAAMTLQ